MKPKIKKKITGPKKKAVLPTDTITAIAGPSKPLVNTNAAVLTHLQDDDDDRGFSQKDDFRHRIPKSLQKETQIPKGREDKPAEKKLITGSTLKSGKPPRESPIRTRRHKFSFHGFISPPPLQKNKAEETRSKKWYQQ